MKNTQEFKVLGEDERDAIAERIRNGVLSGEIYVDGCCIDWSLKIRERKEG